MDYARITAGIFSGAAALLLIYQNHYEPAIAIVSAMLGFFVGEKNGARNTAKD